MSLNDFTIKIIIRKVSQLILGVNYVGMKNQLSRKSFPGGFLRKSISPISVGKSKFCYSGFGLEPCLVPKSGQMSWDINQYDRKCYEDHFEHSQISVGPVEPEIFRKN